MIKIKTYEYSKTEDSYILHRLLTESTHRRLSYILTSSKRATTKLFYLEPSRTRAIINYYPKIG